ncbi:MAG: hypothetical protein FIA97_12530 [Methylococcaceae bacterium]|nr:hypothetical protein [Methylococcaceae bacterium]
MSGEPRPSGVDPERLPPAARGPLAPVGLAALVGGTLASVLLPEGWLAEASLALALVGFVLLLVAGRRR